MRTPLVLAALLALAPLARADEPAVDVSELDNGLDLIVVEKHDAALVTIEIAVKTGSFTETPRTNGLSHLYEHMFFKGNAALPTQERYMKRVGELGIQFNGTTSTERVNYFITLPSRNFAKGMQFMADAILSPLFNMDEMVNERKVVIGEYDRNEANPSHYLWRAMRHQLYGDEAYRKNPLGEREVILSATQDTMRDFQRRYYVPNNACLLVVGDVNLTEVKVLAEQLLGVQRWKNGDDPHWPPRAPLPRLAETKAIVVSEPDGIVGKQKAVVLAAHLPGPDVGRDEAATFVADVWGTLCGLPSGRFQRAFRDGGLAEGGASLGYYTQREGGEIHFSATAKEGKVYECRDALLAEAAAMGRAGYFTEEELKLAKRQLRIARAYEAQSGESLSHNLSFWWASSSIDYYQEYLERCDEVTLDQVAAFVRTYLVGRPMVIACLASKENAEKQGITAERLRPATTTDAAATSGVEELTLDNGLRVLLRREPASALAALDVYFAGGCIGLPEAKQGIDLLLLNTVLEGSKGLTRAQIQQELVGLGARPGVDANYDYSRISVVAPREGFSRAVEIVGECLREPRLEPAVFEQHRGVRKVALQNEKGNADNWVVRLTNKALFAGHPYALRPDGTPEAVAALTVDDLRPRLEQLLGSGRMLLVLVGDVERDAARAMLQAAFGFVKKTEATPLVPGPYRPTEVATFEERANPTTYVMGKAPAPGPSDPDFAAARLTMALLRQRLWESLRTKHALTYAPSAGLSQWKTNFCVIYASTTQPERAVQLMHEELRRLATEPVAKDDLQGLISQEETGAYERNEAVGSHANGLGHAALVAGDWRRHYALPLDVSRVTPEDVQRVAKQFLKDFTWGIIGPKSVPNEVLRPAAPR
jgi:zinc protease